MATFASKYNKTGFGIDTTNFEYVKLSALYNDEKDGGEDVIHNINGIYVNKSPLGLSPVIIDAPNGKLVNLPTHLAETCQSILADSEAVEAIKANKVGYTIYEYEARGKKCYSIRFVDL